jgi:hypothetical protein
MSQHQLAPQRLQLQRGGEAGSTQHVHHLAERAEPPISGGPRRLDRSADHQLEALAVRQTTDQQLGQGRRGHRGWSAAGGARDPEREPLALELTHDGVTVGGRQDEKDCLTTPKAGADELTDRMEQKAPLGVELREC